MTQFMLSVHTVEGERRGPMTDEEMQRSREQIGRVEEEMTSAGALMFSGRLDEPGAATVVRMSNGKVLATDGPFAESREHLGGFYIIDAPDMEAAQAWASKVTGAVGMPIEVRPFAGVRGA